MNETFQDTLRNGYLDWRKNLMLGAPCLLSCAAYGVLFIAGFLALALLMSLTASSGLSPQLSLLFFVGLGSLWILALLFTGAFFSAASLGMSQKAVVGGRATAGDVFLFGSRHVRRVFSVMTLLFLAAVIPVVFFGGVFAVLLSAGYMNVGLAIMSAALALYIPLAAFLYFLSLSATASAAIEEKGGFAALNRGYIFLKENKTRVFLFSAVHAGISGFIGMAYGIVTGPLQWLSDLSSVLSPALSIVVAIVTLLLLLLYLVFISLTLTPLYYVWFVRIYLSQTCGIKKTESSGPVSPPGTPEQSSQRPQLYV